MLGETTDYITGEAVVNTHDERACQTIARFLLDRKGFRKSDLETRRRLTVTVDGNSADRIDKERRILFAMEVLSERECEEYTCSRK